MAGKKQRVATPYAADSVLNQSEEVMLGTSSTDRPPVENPQPTDSESLQALSRTTGVSYVNIDRISKAGSALYQFPALSPPGSLTTLGHISDLAAGMLLFIFEGDVWELEDSYPEIHDEVGNLLPLPKAAQLLTVYQCLDNETGFSPRLQSVVANEKFPTRAIMTETRLIFIGNTDAVQKLLEMNVVTPLTVRPINLTSQRSLAHGSRTSVELDDVNLLVGGRDSIDSPLGHSPSEKVAPQTGLRLETSATDVVKQQLVLVLKSACYRNKAYRAIMGPLNDIANNEVSASTRIRLPMHLRTVPLVSEKFFTAFITGKFDNLEPPTMIKGTASVVGLSEALVDPSTFETLPVTGFAQVLERFFEVMALVTNLDKNDGTGDPTQTERDFYRRLIGTWTAALRGYGPESFESYDVLYVRDRWLQHLMTAHRAVINTGLETSTATITAALEEVWSTNKPLDFTAILADLMRWERTERQKDREAATKRQQLRDVSNPTKSGGKQAGTNASTTGLGVGGGMGGAASSSGSQGPTQTPKPPAGNKPAVKLLCITEMLSVLQYGSKCRNSSSTCSFLHVTSFKDAMQSTNKSKSQLQTYISTHAMVLAKKKTDPAWFKGLNAKLNSM